MSGNGNQNGKVLEETLVGSNSDVVTAISSKISPYSPLTLSHTTESFRNGFVD